MTPDTLCPACGYELGFAAWDGDVPSHQTCPCCGIQFGYDDSERDRAGRAGRQRLWRDRWVKNGMRWWSTAAPPAARWDPAAQLAQLAASAATNQK